MWETLLSSQPQFWNALWQHTQLTVAAVVIAGVIAIPLAIWSERHRRYAEWLLQATGILQTLPSLAVLGLLIPLVGIGWPAALIALIIYALLPIFQNTYLGLTGVEKGIVDAAYALGLPRKKVMRKVQIPLAMPSIIAGIRTATVLIIGTATLAALIGAGGLGDFILLGIDRNNTNLILIGALASAIMAILAGALINLIARLKVKKWLISLLAILFIGGSVWPMLPQKSTTQTITIAGKLGSEPEILINMYADLIKSADPNTNVVLKPNFGKTSFLFNALKSNKIDIYPEFTGTVTATLAEPAVTLPVGANAQTTYQAALKVAQKQQLTLTKPMQFNDTYAVAVTQKDASKYHLKTIADLTQLPNAKAGMTAEFLDRTDGMPGVKKQYNLKIPTVSLDPDLRYQAIKQGQVNVVDAYSTDSQLVQYRLKVLTDNQHFFPIYQGAALMRQDFAKKNPKITRALNRLAGKISNEDMQNMNYAVNVKHQSAATVAKKYLKTHNILK